jgi:hypothetical protein
MANRSTDAELGMDTDFVLRQDLKYHGFGLFG